ncbi:MAG: hypothetical protein V9G24_15685 [Rhodoblastus sp.]
MRDVERIAQQQAEPAAPQAARKPHPAANDDADSRAVAKKLADALGLDVRLRSSGESGEIVIRYSTLDQLDALCGKLTS